MADEIVEEVTEPTEEIQEEITETPDGTEETPIVDEAFDPSKLVFEESSEVEGYNLEAYKDKLDIESDEVMSKAKELKGLGFTQEQVEFYLNERMVQPEVKKPTPKEIQQSLASSLTPAEKKNYNNVVSYARELTEGMDNAEGLTNAIAQNPVLVRLLNKALSGNKSRGRVPAQREVKQEQSMSVEDAQGQYLNWMQTAKEKTPAKRVEFLNSIITDKTNKDELTKAFKHLLVEEIK